MKYPMTKYPNTQRSPKHEALMASCVDSAWGEEVISSSFLKETDGENGNVAPKVYDLEERTARFGEASVKFAKKIPRHPVNDRLISQFVGAATSVGANYCEADDGVSKKDFKNKVGTCKKEARESKHFLRMIAASEPELAEEARLLWREAKELHLIFCAIYRK